MNDNLRAFLKAVASDKEWLASHKALSDRDEAVAAAVAKAGEMGFALSAADFEAPDGELSDDELAVVSGGGYCFCFMGGGGTAADSYDCISTGDQDKACACIVYGEGWEKKYYLEDGELSYYFDDQRCECPMFGEGE